MAGGRRRWQVPPGFVLAANQLLKPVTVIYGTTLFATHLAGVLTFFYLLRYVLPRPADAVVTPELRDSNTNLLLTFVPALMAVAGILTIWLVGWPILQWMGRGGMPSRREFKAIVSAPSRQIAVSAPMWLLMAGVFCLNNLANRSLEFVLIIGVTITSAGLASCLITYFVAERMMRRLISTAMRGAVVDERSAVGVTMRLVLMWLMTCGWPLLIVALIVSARFTGFLFPESARTAPSVMVIALISLSAGAVGMAVVARSISDPVKQVSAAMLQVQAGNADVEVAVYDGSEIGALQNGFNQMVRGLAEREKLSDLFQRRVGADVARHSLDRGAILGGEVREAAVLFVDLVGSSDLMRTWPPDRLVDMLNAFFRVVVGCVHEHGGNINKFTGDAALAVFGAPVEIADPAGAALATARALRAKIPEATHLRFAVGVATGKVVAGNVGAVDRYEYTVIGDPVNEAARLKEVAKQSPGRVLASAVVLDSARSAEPENWRRLGSVRLRGRSTPTLLAEPK